tara:strand:+ start:1 stop:717 length:717 start_codon:yes stop_codon:yes gene_type:complete
MFQYAFGYILAKLKDCDFFYDDLHNFNIKSNLYTGSLTNPINTRSFGDQYADIETLINHSGDIIVNSFLQKSSLYIDHREELRDIFNIKTDTINKDKLVVHIRETDYKLVNAFLGYDFYKSLIDSSKFDNAIIVTDNSSCDTVKRLIDDGCLLSSEGIVDTFKVYSDDRGIQDFKTLMYSENIAISQSSFSWWAAFLGNHKQIIFPFKRNTDWWPILPGKDDVDLYFDFNNISRKYIV